MKILFTKISSQNASLVDEEVSVLGTNNSQNLVRFMKIYHGNLLSRQNGMNHKNFRPLKLGAIQ